MYKREMGPKGMTASQGGGKKNEESFDAEDIESSASMQHLMISRLICPMCPDCAHDEAI